MDPVKQFLDQNTRAKNPSAKFKKIGDKVVGTIQRASVVKTTDRATNQSVDNLVVELLVEHGIEDGVALDAGIIRAVWFKPGEMLRRLGDAMRDVNVPTIVPGDKLAVDFYGEEPSQKMSPKKLYRVAYRQVAVSVPSEVTADSLI